MAAPDRKTFEAAAGWYVQFQSQTPTAAERHAWQQWLNIDPSHQAAWNQMEQLQRSLGALPRISLAALCRPHSNVARCSSGCWYWAAPVTWGGMFSNIRPGQCLGRFPYTLGKRRRIELADGTRIDLNTQTAIDVLFDGRQRLIRLREGEVLIHTGKSGAQMPFYVETQQGRIQALGTRLLCANCRISHRSECWKTASAFHPLIDQTSADCLLQARSAQFNRQSVGVSQPYSGAEAAWVDGQLIVLDARLGDVIDELGRYRPGVLQCDPASARLRVSGTFRLDSTDAVLANLQATLPIQVNYFTRYWVSVKRIG